MAINDGLLRLAHLDEVTQAKGEEMQLERDRFQSLANRKASVVVSSFNLFQTPRDVARRMANELGPTAGKRVLEPSAGLGRLFEATDKLGYWTFVDVSSECCAHLFGLGCGRVAQADFLSCDTQRLGGNFDLVIMNPPFKQGADIKHIKHAFGMISPGGKLVALCFNGVRQNKALKPWADSWEVLPRNSFKSEGTAADVVMLTKTN